MKTLAFLTASLFAGVALLPLPASAEEEIIVTEEVTTESSDDAPAQTIDITTFQEPDPSVPDAPDEFSDAELLQGDWVAPTPEEFGPPKKGSADQLRQVVRIRQIRTIAQRDPAIRREKFRAEAARTPEGRRTLLRNYYLLVHQRMVQLEPTLKEVLEADLVTKLARLEQPRLRPSVLVEPYQPLPGSRAADYIVVVTEADGETKAAEVVPAVEAVED